MIISEISVVRSFSVTDKGIQEPSDEVRLYIPEEATILLKGLLRRYGRKANVKVDGSYRDPVPWALAFLDREYPIGGHVAAWRPFNGGISFAPYSEIPSPRPANFVPKVGLLSFTSKSGLEEAANSSPLFALAWNVLRDCSARTRWLAILDPLSEDWVDQIAAGSDDLWLNRRPSPSSTHSPRRAE